MAEAAVGLPNPHRNYTDNTDVLSTLEPGDLIRFKRWRGIYSHWAVYIGDENVIHMTGDGGRVQSGSGHVFTICGQEFDKAIIKVDNFWKAAEGCKAKKSNSKDQKKNWKHFTAQDIIDRASKRLGPVSYNLLLQNCEHFATWCRYGHKQSDQAEAAMGVIALVSVGSGLLFTSVCRYLIGLVRKKRSDSLD